MHISDPDPHVGRSERDAWAREVPMERVSGDGGGASREAGTLASGKFVCSCTQKKKTEKHTLCFQSYSLISHLQ